MNKISLSKGSIIEKKELNEFLIKDIFSGRELLITISGNEMMNYFYKKGDTIYYVLNDQRSEKGKLMTPTGFKRNRVILKLKKEFDSKYPD